MRADKRLKGCPNELCVNHKDRVKMKGENDYCPRCGARLVYVCSAPKCFSEIEDLGPEHTVCLSCEAEAAERAAHRKELIKNAGEKVGKVVVGVGAAVVAVVVSTAQNEMVDKARKITKEVIDAALKK